MISKNQNQTQYLDKRPISFIDQVDNLILANLDDISFNPDSLSKRVGLSKMQVHRKIKIATGKSTALYIRYLRLNQAKNLLKETDWPISQVAYQVGFQDHSYFSRAFAKEFGMPPRTYRKTSIEGMLL